MRGQGLFSVLVLATALLAGCVQGSAGPSGPTSSTGASVAPPGEFDESTGAITGVVTDTELRPLSEVQLALEGTPSVAESAQDGGFSFSHVPPGDYVLLAAKLGYTSAGSRVSVEAGHETSGVKVSLEPLPVKVPRSQVYQFKGYITCTLGLYRVLSEECGQGIQTDVGTYGTNPNNKIDWRFNLTDPSISALLVEMSWQPGSAAAAKLDLYVAHKFRCQPSCSVDTANGGVTYCGTSNKGPPPQRCQVDTIGIKDPVKDIPWDVTSRAWGAAPDQPTDTPNVVLEQSFFMYRTEFYDQGVPPGYSAIQDQ